MIFLMILRKVYKKREKMRNFSTTLPLLDFYGWAGNIMSYILLISYIISSRL